MKLDDIREHARLTDIDWDIIRDSAYGYYVEVGTHKGASACAASINADSVVTIDIFDWQPKVYKTVYPTAEKKIEFFKGTSLDFSNELKKRFQDPRVIDVLFIDGAHEYEYVMMDCEALVPHVKKGGTVLFHDHNPNNPITRVYEAVNEFLKTIKYKAFDKTPGSSNLLKIEIL